MFSGVPSVIAALLLVKISISHGSENCYTDCSYVWTDKGVQDNAQFQTLKNFSGGRVTERFTWRWKSNKDHGMWDVFYTELPSKGVKSGGFYYIKPIKQKSAFLNWKLFNGTLTWSSQNRQIHLENWNLTICNIGVQVFFKSNGDQWTYQIGNIKIGGGESGNTFVGDDMFSGYVKQRKSKDLIRIRRETEDLEQDRKNTWNKIKGWFKELFDQGPEDARGWMTRIADWILGLLERMLS
ncbi:Hypothetical protein NTJ_07200 [Nesidiocoris tenuis]|uniref:Uncharacterized protein n=1 Tax=Nesidiocoris tenuis TaxID=355587 RepID=A0ABN7AQA7_9HEMI|nr:Hypothetical protein NTJ_07200 [Nesidiocoris tenuis]